MKDLMPIGEFSDCSGLSVKRLRTYATEGFLVPAAVDPDSGYQYYSPSQLRFAQLIDALRQAGMPLVDIRVLLAEPSPAQIDAWERQLNADAEVRQRALALARRLHREIGSSVEQQQGAVTGEVSTMVALHAASRTEKGPFREKNQDAIVTTEWLAMVADGMGGHPGGELAAGAVAGIVRAAFMGHSAEELTAAIRAANWSIWDRAATHPELEGTGTTVCALGLLQDRRLVIAHVGDSRAYLWREGELTQLTRDHSVTAELVERGEIRDDEASQHPHYGILTRALGVAPEVEVDVTTLGVTAADRLVLCSDGLFNELSLGEIARIMTGDETLSSLADTLVERAVDHGGRDNVSAVVAEIAA